MKPLVDVHRTATNVYTYCVSTGRADAASDGGSFESLAHCLFDAAASLVHYFPSVSLNLDGRFIGQYATLTLRRHPSMVARTIQKSLPAALS